MSYPQAMDWQQSGLAAGDVLAASCVRISRPEYEDHALLSAGRDARVTLAVLPNEVLLHVLSFLDVCDLLAASRVSARASVCCWAWQGLGGFLEDARVPTIFSMLCSLLPGHCELIHVHALVSEPRQYGIATMLPHSFLRSPKYILLHSTFELT
jgi:hypothetical protein